VERPYKIRVPIQTRYSDFDMLRHLNNAAYATYLELARLKFLNTIFSEYSIKWLDVVASLTIDYRLPILPENKPVVKVRCTRIGNSSYDLQYLVVQDDDEIKIFAEGKTIQVFIDSQKQIPIPISGKARQILADF